VRSEEVISKNRQPSAEGYRFWEVSARFVARSFFQKDLCGVAGALPGERSSTGLLHLMVQICPSLFSPNKKRPVETGRFLFVISVHFRYQSSVLVPARFGTKLFPTEIIFMVSPGPYPASNSPPDYCISFFKSVRSPFQNKKDIHTDVLFVLLLLPIFDIDGRRGTGQICLHFSFFQKEKLWGCRHRAGGRQLSTGQLHLMVQICLSLISPNKKRPVETGRFLFVSLAHFRYCQSEQVPARFVAFFFPLERKLIELSPSSWRQADVHRTSAFRWFKSDRP